MDLNVELHLPATVFPERWLKLNLGDPLKLMFPSFHHVHRLSTIVLGPRHRTAPPLATGRLGSLAHVCS
ncbi:hypothetical protein GQ55_8G202600 [Panicum hallii var. hallii]|uniref:Uncharacterized protein n=1 Tax=Panicum hallii var. hallii TaxID=1504633 RepID=A0A2T7CPB9_9POAL|nr:hypothetical protein GQ55_8G202600 [Panicum hallii var. hallii]